MASHLRAEFRSRRSIMLALLACVTVSCAGGVSSSAAGGSGDQAAFRTTVCGAVASLGPNRDDFQVFSSDSSTAEAALSALDRMQARTAKAAADLESAATWQPGAEVARTLATNQRELLTILEAFEAVTETGDQAAWTDARASYTDWFNRSQPTIQEAVSQLSNLGVSCT